MSKMVMELFLSDEVQKLLDDYASVCDVRVTFFSLNGELLRRGKEMKNCSYCQAVHDKLKKIKSCISMDGDKQSEVIKSGEIINYRCHAGLHECLAPVYVQGGVAGFLMFGQFRIEGDSEPDWDKMPASVREMMRNAYFSTQCFSEEKLQAVLGMLKTLVDYISVRELAVLQSDRLRSEINSYIEKHASEDIRLPDMARKLGRSVSTISQFLRNNYRTSFKNLLLDARLKIAESMWRKNPGATVSEVAFASGFCDQFYFSRVFSRRRGMPPGKFRNQMRRAIAENEK